MSGNGERILVWSYCHPVDISPMVKGIISFLQHGEFDFSVATDYPFDQNNFGRPVEVRELKAFRPYRLPRIGRAGYRDGDSFSSRLSTFSAPSMKCSFWLICGL